MYNEKKVKLVQIKFFPSFILFGFINFNRKSAKLNLINLFLLSTTIKSKERNKFDL